MTVDFGELLKVLASVASLLTAVCAFGLWAMRSILRAELAATLDRVGEIDGRVKGHGRRLDHVEERVDRMAA